MIDMKRPKPKKSDQSYDEYPYGLRLSLERQEIKKLGLDISKSKMGQNLTITAQGEITGLSMSERKGEDDDKTVSIQIKKLEIKNIPKSLYDDYRKQKKAGKLD